MAKTYKIRRYENGSAKKTGKTFVNYSLTVPNHIAEMVPAGIVFECEMTDDGILFRPAVTETVTEVPTWAQPASENGKKKRSTPRKRPGQKPEPAAETPAAPAG